MNRIVTPSGRQRRSQRLISALRGRFGFLAAVPIGQSVLEGDYRANAGHRQKRCFTVRVLRAEWITSLVLCV